MALQYVQNEDPGPVRRKLYYSCFQATKALFSAGFAHTVETNYAWMARVDAEKELEKKGEVRQQGSDVVSEDVGTVLFE